MKLFSLVTVGVSALVLASCGDSAPKDGKTLVVFSSGKMQVDKANPTQITFEPSNQANEEILKYPADQKVTVTVKTPEGDKTFDLPENGAYLLNLKKDTLVGGIVNFGNSGMQTNISNEELDKLVDSTQKLLLGQNVSDANKNYWLPPMVVKKVSANQDARIIGPMEKIPRSVEVDKDGKAPEVYKFYTNTQKRRDLNELDAQRKK